MRISIGHQALPVLPGTGSAPAASAGCDQMRPALWLRLSVLMLRGRLDREIVAGVAQPQANRALALPINQLTDKRTRRNIARELRRVVDYADRDRSSPVISCVIVERSAVREGRKLILGLAERLESDAPASAAGIVLARALLTEAASPLHNPYSRQTVDEAILEVQDALAA